MPHDTSTILTQYFTGPEHAQINKMTAGPLDKPKTSNMDTVVDQKEMPFTRVSTAKALTPA